MQPLLTVKDLAVIFQTSEASIRMAMYRKRWDCIPPPLKMGKRCYWRECQVQDWLTKKVELTYKKAFEKTSKNKIGRPSKQDAIIASNTPRL
jgi:predicted DNA-binding transcriptional regulator AlpA